MERRPVFCGQRVVGVSIAWIAALLLSCDRGGELTSQKVVPGMLVIDPAICATLVSNKFAQTYFRGLERSTKATKIASSVVACDLTFADPQASSSASSARIELVCGTKVNDAGAIAEAQQQYQALGTAVSSLGKLAFAFGPGNLQFWDDDSTCSVRIDAAVLGDALIPAAHALAAELGPASVPK